MASRDETGEQHIHLVGTPVADDSGTGLLTWGPTYFIELTFPATGCWRVSVLGGRSPDVIVISVIRHGTPFSVCGTLSAFRSPTRTEAGSITVAGQDFAISADAIQDVSPAARPESEVCLSGEWVTLEAVGRNLIELSVTPRVAPSTR
ncbi:MAG: hypothetical protein HYX56_05910 [Chloroflexi bacterium]|nr:hypothetical protein [Chloroflexota bacterium]